MAQRSRLAVGARRPLADELVDHLLAAVLDGTYPPGSTVPAESVLAAEAGVSRLTVREAIRVLADKGVVRVERGRGTYVNAESAWSPFDHRLLQARAFAAADPTAASRALLEVRRLVEEGVAGLAASRRDDAHVAELAEHLAVMRDARDAHDTDTFVKADIAFHAVLMDAVGNPFIVALFEPVAELVYRARAETSSDAATRDHAIAMHEAIVVAVESGDPAASAQAMRDHMLQTEHDLERLLLEREAGDAGTQR